MDDMQSKLATLNPGRVLDLATGSGSFALRLAEGLGSYGEIVAVDSQARAVANAARNLAGTPRARVQEGDAEALPFEDSSFDLVSVAFSLHHFRDPRKALGEAFRVLAPGGWLLVFEMHREAASEEALTHVMLHHWWAAIDSLCGVFHLETFDRAAIRSLVAALPFASVEELEVVDEEGDPRDPGLVTEIEDVIASYLARLPAASEDAGALKARGEELRERTRKIGFRSAPALFLACRK